MPELPEVEIVARSLNELVRGQKIEFARLHRKLLAPKTTPAKFASILRNKTINSVGRRGKHILFDMSGDVSLIVHLRMSGKFLLLDSERENPKFTHAEFFFGDHLRLVFQDQRHFGHMHLLKTVNLFEAPELKKLAPEPFSSEFSLNYLKNCLSNSKRPIKEFLLDQTKVCGLGNIYACEAMFLARIHPMRPATSISTIKARRLHRSIIEILSISIEQSSHTVVDPGNIENRYYSGGSGGNWLVYDREGAPCAICGNSIKRIRQGARSSYFCPRCQRNR